MYLNYAISICLLSFKIFTTNQSIINSVCSPREITRNNVSRPITGKGHAWHLYIYTIHTVLVTVLCIIGHALPMSPILSVPPSAAPCFQFQREIPLFPVRKYLDYKYPTLIPHLFPTVKGILWALELP